MKLTNRWMPAAGAAILAVSMNMTGMPVLAAAGDAPSDNKTTQVQVLNIEEAAKVTAYRIVEPTYNEEGFVRFSTISGAAIADIEHPTAAEVTTIAQSILGGTLVPAVKVDLTGSGSTYTGSLKAGSYVVLVTDQASASWVYNPMVISAYYTDANEADSLTASAPLDATGKFGTVYAKKTAITLDKTILRADGVTVADNDAPGTQGSEADELGVGDTASFQITTRIPAYSDAYRAKGVTYKLVDTQDDGFDPPTGIVVKVGGTTVNASASTFLQNITGNDFTLDFDSDFALVHAGQDVAVTYQAKLNNSAKQKFEANKDSVTLTYTNDVYDKSHVDTLTDEVKEYTFPVQVKKIEKINGQSTGESELPLSGAEFTLTRTDGTGKTGTNTYVIATDDNGIAQFDRLDEGTYSIKETKAPAGYAINPDEFQIKITPAYNADGSLKQYQVSMRNVTQNAAVKDLTVSMADGDILAGNITDSKLQTLPAAGGTGTRILLILASGMAGVTACLYVLGRKKETSEK